MKSNTIYPNSYDKKIVSEQNTLKKIIELKELEVGHYNLDSDEIIQVVQEWLVLKLSVFPDGEWGEKSMLLELLDELGAYKK